MRISGSDRRATSPWLRLGWTFVLLWMGSGMTCWHAYQYPHEPFVWDDDAPIASPYRADVVEAQNAVIQYLRSRGAFSGSDGSCRESLQSLHVSTTETADAYQVFLERNRNLCDMPGEIDPPRSMEGIMRGSAEWAVRKKDLRVLRVRFPGDETKQSRAGEPPRRKRSPPPDVADGGAIDEPAGWGHCPDGGYVTIEGDFIRLSEHFHQVPVIYPECINRLIPRDAGADAGQHSSDAGQPSPDSKRSSP